MRFFLHLEVTQEPGKAAVILPHGVLFRGNKEAVIRKCLVDQGYIAHHRLAYQPLLWDRDPCLCHCADKENANQRESIYFINASKGYVKDGSKNRLREQDVHKIVDYYINEIQKEDTLKPFPCQRFVRMPTITTFVFRDTLNQQSRKTSTTSEPISAEVSPTPILMRSEVLGRLQDVRLALLAVTKGLLHLDDEACTAPECHCKRRGPCLQAECKLNLDEWKQAHETTLKALDGAMNPKQLIARLAEDLLRRFANDPLLDQYDIYQTIVEYWYETMQDDVFILAEDGWGAARRFARSKRKKRSSR